MPEIKHTPGPWEIERYSDGLLQIVGDVRVIDYDEEHVTTIVEAVSYSNEANAKLIAAAPELLADLQEAATTLRRYETLHRAKGTDDSTAKAEVNAALAARFEATIAKATE